jgi:hypothetical protein
MPSRSGTPAPDQRAHGGDSRAYAVAATRKARIATQPSLPIAYSLMGMWVG